ncbi:hypothetical protein IAT38_001955 [Cryptococcus sp. DSM 104549]
MNSAQTRQRRRKNSVPADGDIQVNRRVGAALGGRLLSLPSHPSSPSFPQFMPSTPIYASALFHPSSPRPRPRPHICTGSCPRAGHRTQGRGQHPSHWGTSPHPYRQSLFTSERCSATAMAPSRGPETLGAPGDPRTPTGDLAPPSP